MCSILQYVQLFGVSFLLIAILQGLYSLAWISEDQIKFKQKISYFDKIFSSTEVDICKIFDLNFD